MHGAMARMLNVHMHIHGAIAPRHGLQGSYGTLYGSREQEKHRVQRFFMWYSMVFNTWCPQGYGHHDWFLDIHVVNLKECITYLALWDRATFGLYVHNMTLEYMACVVFISLHIGSIMPSCVGILLPMHLKKIPLPKSLDVHFGYCENDKVCIEFHNIFVWSHGSSHW